MILPVFAVDRMDTWVLRVSIAVPVVCLGGLLLWQLLTHLAGKLAPRRRAVRQSPEPPSARVEDDPDRLERACAALAGSLAAKYLELAECRLRQGQHPQAVAALQAAVRACPGTRQADLARDRLRQLGAAADDR
jgi:cytochrome c-type biogenesis protein CcmH/NrfG